MERETKDDLCPTDLTLANDISIGRPLRVRDYYAFAEDHLF